MSIDRRKPGTWDNDTPGGPAVLREIINKDLGDLSTQDREAIKNAGGAFIRYTAFAKSRLQGSKLPSAYNSVLKFKNSPLRSTVLGAGLGAMLALRGRYHFSQWKKLPRLFPNGLAAGPNADALRDRAGFFMRAIAFSMGGVLVGQSVGFMLGTWKSAQIIKREGNYENIEKVMKRVQQDIKDNYGKANQGAEDAYAGQGRAMPPAQRRKLQGINPESTQDLPDTTRLERPFAPDSGSTPTDPAWASETRSNGFENSSTAAASVPATSEDSSRKSRWEELRGIKDSRDSAWERIRQTRGRSEWEASPNGRSSAPGADGQLLEDRPASEMFDEDKRRDEEERRRSQTKERERREYEKMFERESKGLDSVYTPGSGR